MLKGYYSLRGSSCGRHIGGGLDFGHGCSKCRNFCNLCGVVLSENGYSICWDCAEDEIRENFSKRFITSLSRGQYKILRQDVLNRMEQQIQG